MKEKTKYVSVLLSVYILSNALFLLVANQFVFETGKVFVHITYHTFAEEDLSIYWDKGQGFSDQNHLTIQTDIHKKKYTFCIESTDSIKEIRLDPDSKFKLALLEEISISGLQKPLQYRHFNKDATNGITLIFQNEKWILLRDTLNTDPYLTIHIPNETAAVSQTYSAKDLLFIGLSLLTSLIILLLVKEAIRKKMAKLELSKCVLVLIFVLICSSYWLNLLLRFYTSPPSAENRKLSDKPRFDSLLYHPKKYFSTFDNWFTDHLAYRQALVFAHSFLKINLFKTSPMPEHMYIGKDFEFFSANSLLTDDVTGKRRLSEVELSALLAACIQKQKLLSEQNISYYLTIPPAKQTIYSERLPDYLLLQLHGKKMAEQFKESMNEAKTDFYVDVIDVLKYRHSKFPEERLFYQYDIHWSEWGAFLAYQTLMTTLSKKHDWIKAPLTLDEIRIDTTYSNNADLAKLILMHHQFKREEYRICHKSLDSISETVLDGVYQFPMYKYKNKAAKGRALIFRDSYSEQWKFLIAGHFNESIFIWDQSISQKLIDEYKPDIVIQENCEMFLFYLFNPMQTHVQ